jgi:feruloyl esterase
MKNQRGLILVVAFLFFLIFSPTIGSAHPTCTDLAGLILADPKILSATSVITPAAGTTPAYCQVNLEQYHAINIRVGLPLSTGDGGTGGIQGAWNGKVENLGGGGFAGSVGSVTGPVTNGYVGSSTDTGHSTAWCNAINPETGEPNSLPNCGAAGAGFVLDPNDDLIHYQVTDFITHSLHAQVTWALELAHLYYGMRPIRNYWNGCSTGGRQGFQMAQKYGELFDGFLVGSPAMNWNRFQTGELWAPVVVKDIVGPGGLSVAKSNAANAAAVAACGEVDGIIDEPRRCAFDARSLICTGAPTDLATCLTPAEADAINKIWDGPRNLRGDRIWGGVTFGTSFGIVLPGGVNAGGLMLPYEQQWVHQNPSWDWHQLTLDTTFPPSSNNFTAEFKLSDQKFEATASTDNPDLDKVRMRHGKIIHYHGIADPLILPFGSYNYVSRVFNRYSVQETQEFMRSFFYPGNGHCGGGNAPLINSTDLFNALVNWVENGVAPDYIVARQTLSGGAIRTRKICKYPDEAVYNGSGSTDDQSNFKCVVHATEPPDLEASSFLGPDVLCKNVTVSASPTTCSAWASVDNGSSDRYGDPIRLVQWPPGPYRIGVTKVTLTGTDSRDASSSCQATVTVVGTCEHHEHR